MLWVKTFHVLFVISWLAGIFYLPRIFVNIAAAERAGENTARLKDMALRLYRFVSMLSGLAVIFGLILWLYYDIGGTWLYAKLAFVVLLIVYHEVCGVYTKRLRKGVPLGHGETFFRVFNEVGVLLVLPILIFAIVKPF